MCYANVHVARCTDMWFQRAVKANMAAVVTEPCVVNEGGMLLDEWLGDAVEGGQQVWFMEESEAGIDYTCWVICSVDVGMLCLCVYMLLYIHVCTCMQICLAWILVFSPRSTPFSQRKYCWKPRIFSMCAFVSPYIHKLRGIICTETTTPSPNAISTKNKAWNAVITVIKKRD